MTGSTRASSDAAARITETPSNDGGDFGASLTPPLAERPFAAPAAERRSSSGPAPVKDSAVPGWTGWRRIYYATFFSIAGLRAAWRHEAAFRQECALAAVLIPAAFWLGQTATERALLLGSCLIVLIVELLNSGIEAAVDRIGIARHELSGRAKDLGSAAVLVSLVLVGVVWSLIAWERFF